MEEIFFNTVSAYRDIKSASKNTPALVDNDDTDHIVMMSAIPSEFQPQVAVHNRRSAVHDDARLYRIPHGSPRARD